MSMKRFKAALPCGSWSKEDLVEDKNGAFVKHADVQDIILENEKLAGVLVKIVAGHKQSTVDWPAMREAEFLLSDHFKSV